MFSSWFNEKNDQHSSPNQCKGVLHAVLGTDISKQKDTTESEAFFACGCFWGAEKGFWKLPGVVTTAVGYAGGQVENPRYQDVCTGRTGHTEIVRVVWDNNSIHFSDLLKMFWECHDPTQGNRQGNDSGSQYRSAIYTTTSEQLELGLASMRSYQDSLKNNGFGDITSEIKPLNDFYYAEKYHQQYLAKPGSRPYCSAMPTKVILEEFPGSKFMLPKKIWNEFNWSISHCVLRSDNKPLTT